MGWWKVSIATSLPSHWGCSFRQEQWFWLFRCLQKHPESKRMPGGHCKGHSTPCFGNQISRRDGSLVFFWRCRTSEGPEGNTSCHGRREKMLVTVCQVFSSPTLLAKPYGAGKTIPGNSKSLPSKTCPGAAAPRDFPMFFSLSPSLPSKGSIFERQIPAQGPCVHLQVSVWSAVLKIPNLPLKFTFDYFWIQEQT